MIEIDYDNKEFLEILARLEHEQWMEWSKTLAKEENLSRKRIDRWSKLWKPYDKLEEKEKHHDRFWARQIVRLIKNNLPIKDVVQ